MSNTSWEHQAACRGADPEIFFAEKSDHTAVTAAKSICATCPVTTQCLDYAIAGHERDGIWGGLLPHERRRLMPARRPHRRARCGTPAGYTQHLRDDEDACVPCREAHRRAQGLNRDRNTQPTPRRKVS